MIYAVEMTNTEGETIISRYFDTKRAARKWVKWLRSQRFVVRARIMMGARNELLTGEKWVPEEESCPF